MEVYKIDGDPAATDGQVPDAPARPTVAENVVSDKSDQHLPPEIAEAQRHNAITKNTVGGAAR